MLDRNLDDFSRGLTLHQAEPPTDAVDQ